MDEVGDLLIGDSLAIATFGVEEMALKTVTVIFEFAASATQQFTMPVQGYLLAINCANAAAMVSIDTQPMTSAPNGGLTRVLNGYAWANGLNALIGYLPMRAKIEAGQNVFVRSTTATLVHLVFGFPDT